MTASKGIQRYDRRVPEVPGTVYYRLTVLESLISDWGQALLRCRCTCGEEVTVLRANVRHGYTRSCGCLHRERTQAANAGHGRSGTPLYRVWQSMISRCHNPNAPGYQKYGAQGITVCDRWRRSFVHFLADVGERPTPDHSLDRWPNPAGNYEPGNTRWATVAEQRRNWRNNKFITYHGRAQLLTDWARELGLPFTALRYRLRVGWTAEQAFETPLKPDCRRHSRGSSPKTSLG